MESRGRGVNALNVVMESHGMSEKVGEFQITKFSIFLFFLSLLKTIFVILGNCFLQTYIIMHYIFFSI